MRQITCEKKKKKKKDTSDLMKKKVIALARNAPCFETAFLIEKRKKKKILPQVGKEGFPSLILPMASPRQKVIHHILSTPITDHRHARTLAPVTPVEYQKNPNVDSQKNQTCVRTMIQHVLFERDKT